MAFDEGIHGRAFIAVVVTPVAVSSVAVSFAILIIMFAVVADKVVHGKTVMACNVVYAVARGTSADCKQVAGSAYACGGSSRAEFITTPESADIVTEPVIPFSPSSAWETTKLISTARIPRFSNDLCFSKDRMLRNRICQRREFQENSFLTSCKNRSKVKAESVNVIVCDPVTQAVQNHVAHYRMIAVHCITAAGEIHVVFLMAVNKRIVNFIFKSAEIERNTMFVSFRSVVIYNIKDHFDSGFMKLTDQKLEFIDNAARSLVSGIPSLWREEIDGTVSPIILHSLTSAGIYVRIFVFVEFMDRKQLNCSDAKILEVWNFFHEASVSSRT